MIGSSLRVTPASLFPLATSENGGDIVIINLQKTSIDSKCTLRVFGRCDEFMSIVMKLLGNVVLLLTLQPISFFFEKNLFLFIPFPLSDYTDIQVPTYIVKKSVVVGHQVVARECEKVICFWVHFFCSLIFKCFFF